MREQDAEKVRQALKAALEGLDSRREESGGDPGNLVVVVLGSDAAARKSPVVTDVKNDAPPNQDGCHPGLERFPISSNLAPSEGTKPCFMEPARPCVNSGACEMRGY
jgi:hypothetical protein